MKKKSIKNTIFIWIAVFLIILSGCNYKEMEDRLRDKIDGSSVDYSQFDENTITNPVTDTDGEFDEYGGVDWNRVEYNNEGNPYIEVNTGDLSVERPVVDLQKLKEVPIGQEAVVEDSNFPSISYIVTDNQIWDSLSESDITVDRFHLSDTAQSFLTESGELADNIKLVVVDITIKNLSEDGKNYEGNISDVKLTEKRILNTLYDIESVFFSPSGEGTEYYHYYLDAGDDGEYRVGWFVDTTVLNPDDLILLFGNIDDGYQYVPLDFE